MRVPRDGLELLEDRDRLRCTGYAVGAAHLHARAWDRPERRAKVYFGPVRGSQFAGPDERRGEQLLPSANFGHAVPPRMTRSTIAARARSVGVSKAPLSAAVGSPDARPVANAKRKTEPMNARSRSLASFHATKHLQDSDAAIALMGLVPRAARASRISHSSFTMKEQFVSDSTESVSLPRSCSDLAGNLRWLHIIEIYR